MICLAIAVYGMYVYVYAVEVIKCYVYDVMLNS